MAERLFPTRHRTLAALRDAGLHLFAFCCNPDCRWSAVLDTEQLIDKLGPEHGTMPTDMVPMLVCSQCGGKEIAVTLTASTDEISEATVDYVRESWRSEPS